jgi:HEAT repeat protein
MAIGAVLLVLGGLAVLLRRDELASPEGGPQAEPAASTGSGRAPRAESVTEASGSASSQSVDAELMREVPCDFNSLLEQLRGTSSQARRRYLLKQLKSMAGTVPTEQLMAMIRTEKDPRMLEALAVSVVAQFNQSGNVEILRGLLAHSGGETDPKLRASLVSALRTTVEPASEVLGRMGGVSYPQLMREAPPEVQQAVVDNLLDENKRGNGRFRGIAENAVATATQAADPTLGAQLLSATSIEYAGHQTVASVAETLTTSKHPEMRAAAAKSLGSVSAQESARTLEVLTKRYRAERELAVRKALLEAIARIGFSGAIPTLQSLRDVEPSLRGEVDQWIKVLSRGPQVWELIQRNKQQLKQAAH